MVAGAPLNLPSFQPRLDGLHKVSPELIKALGLADAAGQCGNLSPESAFFCFVDYGTYDHGRTLAPEHVAGKPAGAGSFTREAGALIASSSFPTEWGH